MSYENNQFKELINEAIHNHFHNDTEKEMILKDWLYGIREQLDEYEQHKVATSILVNTLKSKADEYEAKAKAFDVLYASFDKGDKDLSKADFDEALEYESGESDAKK